MEVIAFLGVDERHHVATQKPHGHASPFAIAETVIFIRVREAQEHSLNINEVHSMFLEVQTPLPLIPRDDWHIVYMDRICAKRNALRGLTVAEMCTRESVIRASGGRGGVSCGRGALRRSGPGHTGGPG